MKKILSIMLALLMVVSIIPMSVLADSAYSWTVATSVESTIAKGVVQTSNVAYNTEGNRVAFYTITADITRDDVGVYANYYNNQLAELGMQTVIDQAHAAEANHADVPNYKVVATTNADFYNMTTGKPSGVLVMEGVALDGMGESRSFFGIKKDGTPIIGKAGTYSSVASEIQEAVGGSVVILYDGQVLVKNTDRTATNAMYPRSIAGYTPEGKVVLMVADGQQPPVSAGMSYYDVAIQMQAMGCTYAIELDGGGSATMATKAEGENELSVLNKPSNGAMRNVSSSLIVVSTAVADGTFDHAALTAEETYVSPESTVKVDAIGADAAGGAAEIPEDVSWQLKDASMGTVKDGVFTSNGTVGEAVVQMVYNEKVVGETTINVVIPEEIKFAQQSIVVPYDRTIDLEVKATVNGGVNEVKLKDGDIKFELSNANIGTLNGSKFTACDESTGLTSGTITATFADTDLTCSAELVLGKASEVIADFEDGTEDLAIYLGSGLTGDMYTVTKETGKVFRGDKALAMEMDLTDATYTFTGGYLQGYLVSQWILIDEDATSFGVWVYLPEIEDLEGLALRLYVEGYNYNYSDVYTIKPGDDLGYNGWRYISADISDINDTYIYFSFYPMIQATNEAAYNEKYTFYVDDFTVDYSSAVDDREPPVFDDIGVFYEGIDTPVPVKGQVVNKNNVSFIVKATEDTTKSNYTGLDFTSAKAYVDGVELSQGVKCAEDGSISISNIKLDNGMHTVRFELCDNMGNKSYKEGYITIEGESAANTISVVPSNPNANRLPIGSLYWLDVKADAIEDVQSVTTVVNLNSMNTWELEHMEVAEGFSASYSVDSVTNNAEITISKTGESDLTGAAVLAKLPIRTWESDRVKNGEYTPEQMWTKGWLYPMDIELSTDLGKVTFVDGSTSTFSMTPVAVDTELYSNAVGMGEDYTSKTSWHQHTAEAIADKTATCTTTGYTDRTFCEECNSVVDWGTTVKATGHTYEVEDGILKCKDCDKLFNGELDGKTYVDGVMLDGWVGDKYYKDGAMLTGVKAVDGVYYNFGEDGNSKGKYTGDFFAEDGKHYYAKLGVLEGGWFTIDDEWYYFDETTFAGVSGEMKFFNKVTYTFDETGRLTSGVWYTDEIGTKYYYGPDYYKTILVTIDGKEYYFSNGYRYEEGIHCLRLSAGNSDVVAYEMGENGAIIGEYKGNGLINTAEGKFYLKDGIAQRGLYLIDGDYYYFHTIYGYAYVYRKYNVTKTNGYDFTPGVYEFDANGVIVTKNGYFEENGTTYYYLNNVKIKNALVQVGDDFYYFGTDGQPVKDCRYYASNSKCDLPAKEYYYFDAEGKALKGVVNGKLYLDGKLAPTGITKVGEDYYYSESGKVIVDRKYYASKSNCDLAAKDYYYFGADGKALQGVVDGYLYLNGQRVKRGLAKIGDDYYYSESGKVITDRRYYATISNCDLPAKDYYYFGVDGKMLQGVVEGYLYINGQRAPRGLTKFGNDYYYSETGEVITNRRYYATLSNCDLPAKEYYYFGADGKALQGVVERDGVLQLYINGQKAVTGLTKFGDDYYYSESGEVVVGRKYYAAVSNCDLAAKDYYYFGEDGKMLQGLVEGCLYINGQKAETGLTKFGDDYYYSESGKVATGKYYASKTNCELPAKAYYYFGEDGKMLNGVVNGYYYENGQYLATGLTKIGEDYYYIESGKVATGKYYASKTNCELPAKAYYYFGEDGKMLNGVVNGYYYENGQYGATGLTKVGEDYYYVEGGKVITGRKYYAKVSNCDLPAEKYYYFDEDGTFCEGIYTEEDGIYYYEAGKRVYAGLVKVDGDFYYAGSGGKCVTGIKMLCNKSSCVLPVGREYTFGEDGKIVK